MEENTSDFEKLLKMHARENAKEINDFIRKRHLLIQTQNSSRKYFISKMITLLPQSNLLRVHTSIYEGKMDDFFAASFAYRLI